MIISDTPTALVREESSVTDETHFPGLVGIHQLDVLDLVSQASAYCMCILPK